MLHFFPFVHIVFNCLTRIKKTTFFLTNPPPSTLLYKHKNAVPIKDLRCLERKKKRRVTTNFLFRSLPAFPAVCLIPFPRLPFLFVAVVAIVAFPCLALLCLSLPCLACPCLALPNLTRVSLAFPLYPVPCLALPCLALRCLALSCLLLLYPALPCLALT